MAITKDLIWPEILATALFSIHGHTLILHFHTPAKCDVFILDSLSSKALANTALHSNIVYTQNFFRRNSNKSKFHLFSQWKSRGPMIWIIFIFSVLNMWCYTNISIYHAKQWLNGINSKMHLRNANSNSLPKFDTFQNQMKRTQIVHTPNDFKPKGADSIGSPILFFE